MPYESIFPKVIVSQYQYKFSDQVLQLHTIFLPCEFAVHFKLSVPEKLEMWLLNVMCPLFE